MKYKFFTIILILSFTISTNAIGAIITFDPPIVPTTNPIIDYHEFNWNSGNGKIGFTRDNVNPSGYNTLDPDGNVAYNLNAEKPSQMVFLQGTFNLNSVDFTSAWDAQVLYLKGFSNKEEKYSIKESISKYAVRHLDLNWQDIDTLWISSSSWSQWAMDNIDYEPCSTVPVPTSILLLGCGLTGLFGYKKFKK